MALAEKKCVPCTGETQPLTHDEAEKYRPEVPDWELHNDHIEKTFKFSNFVNAMKFAVRITKVAEEENHHPDLHISWGKVRVESSTHSIGGLSENDFILAAKIDRIAEKDEEAQAI